MRKIYSFNTQLYKVTGVEKVMMTIHRALLDVYESRIVGLSSYSKVCPSHGIREDEYIRFYNPFMFYRSIVIIHERKLLPFFWILNNIFFQKIKLVYVHHSILYGKYWISPMPNVVVAIADRGVKNLIEYFKVPKDNIHKIHNCVKDEIANVGQSTQNENVTVLYPGRINAGKRQKEIVKQLRGKLDYRVRILFAGDGPQYEEFKEMLAGDKQFVPLGFVDNLSDLMRQCDYVMLFSTHEGLPISLIEATMCGIPIVCNDVGGNTEIAKNGENAYVSFEPDNWNWLCETLNSLPSVDKQRYQSMSANSRAIYEKYFTFDVFKNKYLTLMKSLEN